jgi:CheY-like chemotaxis protein
MESDRVLVVEDEALLAIELARIVADVTAAKPVMADTVKAARQAVRNSRIDLAVLDISLPDGTAFEVADYLLQQGTPYMFVTALDRSTIPLRHRAAPVVSKPFGESEVRVALTSVLGAMRRAF